MNWKKYLSQKNIIIGIIAFLAIIFIWQGINNSSNEADTLTKTKTINLVEISEYKKKNITFHLLDKFLLKNKLN